MEQIIEWFKDYKNKNKQHEIILDKIIAGIRDGNFDHSVIDKWLNKRQKSIDDIEMQARNKK